MKLNSVWLELQLLSTANAIPVTNSNGYHIHKSMIDPIIRAMHIRWAIIYFVKEDSHETEYATS